MVWLNTNPVVRLPTLILCILGVNSGALVLDVLVNQVGYEPNSPKLVRDQRAIDYAGGSTFSLRRISDGSLPYSGTLSRQGPLWDKWYWQGGFSEVKVSGDLYVSAAVDAENGSSCSFTIAPGVPLSR